MGKLTHRLDALERRRLPAEVCPEHLAPAAIDTGTALRSGLRAFSPDPAERAAYLAEQEAKASQPPCARCGWTPFVVIVQPVEAWGPSDGTMPEDTG
jgi:hypothetical protein